ncbi:MAG: Skp family chaperone for outer membrane protein [Phycisphaerales bacterium]|jgi:Skp family chaperone for outer membrane proteins
MFIRKRMQRLTYSLATVAVVCIVAGYAAVAASTHFRPPTVVVTFSIERVSADLTERADSEASLRILFSKVETELKSRNESMTVLQETLQSAADADKPEIVEQLNQLAIRAMSYKQFAERRVDTERSLMFRDLYLKIKSSVADIANENGYDLVLITDDDREILVNPQADTSQEFQVREQIGQQRVVFASGQIDITEQIVTHMNLEWEKRSDK